MGLGGAALTAAVAFVGLHAQSGTDFDTSAKPAIHLLRAGHLGGFLDNTSVEAGSYILRLPFILMPGLWGGGDLAVYRLLALPCLIASLALGFLIWRRADELAGARAALVSLLLLVANPFLLSALLKAHPEEVLGASLCVGAVIAAGRSRPDLAMVLLGLAIGNKPWAVVAILPVLFLLKARRVRALAIMSGVAGAVYLPLVIRGTTALHGTVGAAQTGGVFQPWQVWWFFGDGAHLVPYHLGHIPTLYRAAPSWVGQLNHPVAVLLPMAICLVLARRVVKRSWEECLLLLALALLIRCMFDAANIAYYHLPFVFSLIAWEVYAGRGVPRFSAAVTVSGWLILALLPPFVSPDVSALTYLLWSIPLASMLALRLWNPDRFALPRLVRVRPRAYPSSIASPSATAGVPSARS
jgi:hypothetical protein